MDVKKDIRLRVYIGFMLMVFFALAILIKGTHLYLVKGKELIAYADSISTREEILMPERGNIYTEDGSLVSVSIPEFDICMDANTIPKDTFYKYIDALSEGLAVILSDRGKSAWDYKSLLIEKKKKNAQYYVIARRVSYSQYLAIKQLQPFCKGANKGGFITDVTNKRLNPFGILANRTVGLWRKNAPSVGLEDAYDDFLKGFEGRRITRKIAGGAFLPIDGSEIDPENGKDIITTLDMNIQDVAENALIKQLEKDHARYGTCIVMETKTGKIKAMANLGRQPDGTYYEDKNYALYPIEPGSTTKVISLASLVRDHKIHVNDPVNCRNGSIRFGNHVISDHGTRGFIPVKEALAKSSNVAFSSLIYENYAGDKKTYLRNLRDLGLDKPTGLGIKGELKTRLNENYALHEKHFIASMGIGYGIQVTPLHMCMVYNMIANNGTLLKPYIVHSIEEYGKPIVEYKPTVLYKNYLKEDAVEQVKEAMYAVVDHGTGKALKNPYYDICGKTGTSKVIDQGIKHADRVYNASFIGFFPKDDPQYTICVVIRTSPGSSNYFGGQLALPVFQEVAHRLYATHVKNPDTYVRRDSIHHLPTITSPDKDKLQKISGMLNLPVAQLKVDSNMFLRKNYGKGKVPDVRGLGLKNAIYVLENAGLKVITVGKGKVKGQSLSPGEIIDEGQKITINLS